MEPWSKYFIVDTSVVRAAGLSFGRGFIKFLESGDPHFGYKAENVHLYDKQEEAAVDFDKIPDKVAIIHITISQDNGRVNVSHTKVASK